MVMKMYTVKDVKTGIFNAPVYCHNTAHAMRVMSSVFQNDEHQYSLWPEDFTLYEVGSFDDNTGVITGVDPIYICTFAELKEARNAK